MIAVLMPYLFYAILVRTLNCVSKSACKTVFSHLNVTLTLDREMKMMSPGPKVEAYVSMYAMKVLYMQGYWQVMCDTGLLDQGF